MKIKGVNLGGWLVLEKWMTPSLFTGTDAIDEHSFMQAPDAERKLREHHDSFITAQDFEWLAKNGINSVRIPVGYWIFDGDKPYVGAIEKLDWAVRKAKKNNLKVLIDLHGAPGSQNGKDHSGKNGEALWFKDMANQEKTTEVLIRLAKRYKADEHVFGLQMLNEPKSSPFNFTLRRFYNQAYRELTKVARPGLHIFYHDAFQPVLMSRAIKNHNPNFPVVQDSHWYHVFTDRNIFQRTSRKYFNHLHRRGKIYNFLNKHQKLMIGEWSNVISSKMLNGLSAKSKHELIREHGQIQMQIFNDNTSGWFYWSYKTEEDGPWNFRSQLRAVKSS